MIGNTSIEIITDPLGTKQYRYKLHDGDVYYISYQWMENCGLTIPQKGALFYFGGRALVRIDDDSQSLKSISAIDARRFWRLRYLLAPAGKWMRLIERRIVITLAVWNLIELSPGEVPGLRAIVRRWKKQVK